MTTRFESMYRARLDAGKYVCVGLDPDLVQIPDHVRQEAWPPSDSNVVETFVKGIVDATHHVAAAYKPQIAYYEALGREGFEVLHRICSYIRAIDGSIPIILDYKRGDIGRTSEQYVEAAVRLNVDAVTVNPYLGMEAMKPFLDQTDKHVFVLCRTSNPGAGEFQNLFCHPFVDVSTGQYYSCRAEATREGANIDELEPTAMMDLYEFIALRVARSWNRNGNCGLVVGATAPDELRKVRRLVGGNMIILVPGIGTQGGDLLKSIQLGGGDEWLAEVFNNSSAIMFAYKKGTKSSGEPYEPHEWGVAAMYAAESMNHETAMLV